MTHLSEIKPSPELQSILDEAKQVPQCICRSGKPEKTCPYITQREWQNHEIDLEEKKAKEEALYARFN